MAFPSADIPAYPAVPWSDFYMQGAPFSNQLHSQMPLSSMAGGQYFREPYLLQVPNGTALESMPQTGKQKGVTPPEQSSYQSHQTEPELAALPEKEDAESSSKKAEIIVGNQLIVFLQKEGGKERAPRQQKFPWMQGENSGMIFLWAAAWDSSHDPIASS